MKKIAIIIDRAPCDGVAETLRMAAGLTMLDDQPSLYFLGEGIQSANPDDEHAFGATLQHHLKMLAMMQVPLITSQQEGAKMVAGADIVISG